MTGNQRPNPYSETDAEIDAVLNGMAGYFCIQNRRLIVLAKVSLGGERYGHESRRDIASPGMMLVYNPANGYRFVVGSSFGEFYCPIGSSPPPPKHVLQQDGARKGKSRHSLASADVSFSDDFDLV
jgi:hypothetical protein